ncbi:hypothetical protein PQQ51_04795 [Paraburkholderia xenovorans]|uniref:hypothetical protein n=1 Tax=Paraburkholderia xenovorans TaxID=36873 RepID=UPI0038B6CAC2
MGRFPLKRLIERFYPLVIAVVAALGAHHLNLRFESDKYSNQLSSTINVSAILMGFLGTAQAMLLTFNSKTFRGIRGNKRLWALLLSYFRWALLASLALCVFSLILFSIDVKRFAEWQFENFKVDTVLMPCWIALSTFAFLTFYRVVKVIFGLLNDPSVGTGQ